MVKKMENSNNVVSNASPLELLKQQRSHTLFVLNNACSGQEAAFLNWYKHNLLEAITVQDKVLSVQHFEQHSVDITQGSFKPLDFHYLSLIELSLDGGGEAAGLIDTISKLHEVEPSATSPAIWLYYSMGEKVGRSPVIERPMMTLAFANAVEGADVEFREWYNTRHIRHALNIPALVSGQCFALSEYQKAGAMESKYQLIAIYEQEGSPQEIIDSFNSITPGLLSFPSLDTSTERFTEWVYQAITEKLCCIDKIHG